MGGAAAASRFRKKFNKTRRLLLSTAREEMKEYFSGKWHGCNVEKEQLDFISEKSLELKQYLEKVEGLQEGGLINFMGSYEKKNDDRLSKFDEIWNEFFIGGEGLVFVIKSQIIKS